MEWVKPFEYIIDTVTFDFVNARINYYSSLDSSSLMGYSVNNIKRPNSRKKLKKALLKNSFKLCYSILDQICFGIIDALEIDVANKLKEKSEINGIPDIYFLNVWDLGIIDEKLYDDNFYLISLYSIAKDLNRDKYSALKDFKNIRNEMEHGNIKIVDNEIKGNRIPGTYSKNELTRKTKLRLILTKSCIFSFNNLVRRRSRTMQID